MNTIIETAISKIEANWKNLEMQSILNMKLVLQDLSLSQDLLAQLKTELKVSANGIELYRHNSQGFVLLAYSEAEGTYRIPHNHGDAWVIYAVAYGEVEMGNYFRMAQAHSEHRLILKNRERLIAGDTRLYLPGEIHDTKCISPNAVILRLTSNDLKEEERLGRMQRFQL